MHAPSPSPDPSPAPGAWETVGRPGYAGRRRRRAAALLDAEHGPGGWRIVYQLGDAIISRDEALEHYTESYFVLLRDDPELLEWLVRTAQDVYDTEPSNVNSGTDYSEQEGAATHLQDIAVRIALQRLGREFEGSELIRIRGKKSKGRRLSPAVVPFHAPALIRQPELESWWDPGSVESFWQSNKLLQVFVSPASRPKRVLIFGGSFNPIHNGHMAAARYCRDVLGFDLVVFVPNGDNYGKPDLAEAWQRLALVRMAVEGEAGFVVNDVETKSRRRFRGVETARELRKQHGGAELVLFRGLDALKKTHRGYFSIPGLRVLVLDRAGSKADFEQAVTAKPHLESNRDRIDYRGGVFSDSLSSSQVRRALAARQPITEMVPKKVASAIEEWGLYGTAAAG